MILHLVTNLPSPEPPTTDSSNGPDGASASTHINIIPPRKERILSCIGKFYDVIKNFDIGHNTRNANHSVSQSGQASTSDTSSSMPDVITVDEQSRQPEAQQFTAKNMPTLDIFEDVFVSPNNYAVNDSDLFKISDQVLGAVQLKEGDPSTSGLRFKRQACDQDVEENGFANKRKVCDFAETEFGQLQEPANVVTFEPNNIDSLFDDNGRLHLWRDFRNFYIILLFLCWYEICLCISGLDGALNMIQSFGDTEAISADVFPDILVRNSWHTEMCLGVSSSCYAVTSLWGICFFSYTL